MVEFRHMFSVSNIPDSFSCNGFHIHRCVEDGFTCDHDKNFVDQYLAADLCECILSEILIKNAIVDSIRRFARLKSFKHFPRFAYQAS